VTGLDGEREQTPCPELRLRDLRLFARVATKICLFWTHRSISATMGLGMLHNDFNALSARLRDKIWLEFFSGCWLWLAAMSGYKRWYGVVWDWEARRMRYAHLIIYEKLGGIIPVGLQADHLCKTPSCVNPLHLEFVTPRINTLRSNSLSALCARKTHCPSGHPYDHAKYLQICAEQRQALPCM
jgi:hypothetical protein